MGGENSTSHLSSQDVCRGKLGRPQAENVTRKKHKVGFHNRGVQWDTPMSRWAGEGKDWIQPMAQGPPRKEDVTISLLKMIRQPTEKKPQKGKGALKKKPRDVAPLVPERAPRRSRNR